MRNIVIHFQQHFHGCRTTIAVWICEYTRYC